MDGEDFYGEAGCCLTCPDSYTGCLCFECKCTKCEWYEELEFGGRCTYFDYKRESVIIDVKYIRETEKAYLVVVDKREIWIPKSIILNEYWKKKFENFVESIYGSLTLPYWFIEQEDLTDFTP